MTNLYLGLQEKNKAGDIKTNAEKTDTDKKRERRKKKTIKRFKIKEREKRQKLTEKIRAEKGKKQTKQEAEASVKKLTKEGKATLLKVICLSGVWHCHHVCNTLTRHIELCLIYFSRVYGQGLS